MNNLAAGALVLVGTALGGVFTGIKIANRKKVVAHEDSPFIENLVELADLIETAHGPTDESKELRRHIAKAREVLALDAAGTPTWTDVLTLPALAVILAVVLRNNAPEVNLQ